MADAAFELRAILDSAEQAASVQDFASAEHYLRQAATLQEAQLGLNHPDLANTLNNLGIVCERTGKAAEAESCYRRAYAIASSTLPPEDPLVVTSGQNLRDFCAATGKPLETSAALTSIDPSPAGPTASAHPDPGATASALPPPAPPAPHAEARSGPVTSPLPPAIDPPTSRAAALPSPSSRVGPSEARRTDPVQVARSAVSVGVESLSRHRGVIWALIATGLVLAIVLAGRWARPSDSAAPASTSETPRVDTAAPPEPQEPQEPQKQPGVPSGTATETPAVAATPERPAIDPPARTPAPDKTSTAVTTAPSRSVPTVSLVESQLCRTLSNWRCTPAGNPAGPGVFIFYTRVRSARDTRVQHRWYLNGTLLQSVQLRVGANPGRGYRTYSRSTVNAERRGDWTIEVRDAGGALLHEERFVVR